MKKAILTLVSFIVVLFVFSGCGGSGGDSPEAPQEVAAVPEAPIESPAVNSEEPVENPTVSPEEPVETPVSDPEAPVKEPEPTTPTPAPTEPPIIVAPVEPAEPAPEPEPEPEPIPYVFHFTFEGINTFVEYDNPLNSYFESYIGKPMYGVVHLDTRDFVYNPEIGIYEPTNPAGDNYIDLFVEDLYVRAYVIMLDYLSQDKDSFVLWTSETYDYETVQFPEHLDKSLTVESIRIDIFYSAGDGYVEWTLLSHGSEDPYLEGGDIQGGGDVKITEHIY